MGRSSSSAGGSLLTALKGQKDSSALIPGSQVRKAHPLQVVLDQCTLAGTFPSCILRQQLGLKRSRGPPQSLI